MINDRFLYCLSDFAVFDPITGTMAVTPAHAQCASARLSIG
jgi:hypothetical protein